MLARSEQGGRRDRSAVFLSDGLFAALRSAPAALPLEEPVQPRINRASTGAKSAPSRAKSLLVCKGVFGYSGRSRAPFWLCNHRRPRTQPAARATGCGAISCTHFVNDRQTRASYPRCATVCPTESIVFGRASTIYRRNQRGSGETRAAIATKRVSHDATTLTLISTGRAYVRWS